MSDNNDQTLSPKLGVPDPGHSAGDIEQAPGAGKPANVGQTAEAEITAAHAREEDLSRHDRAWQRERSRLATSSVWVPDFDLGSRGHRNLIADYEERRTDWERRQAQIIDHHDERRDAIRANGRTLTAAFGMAAVSGESQAQEKSLAKPSLNATAPERAPGDRGPSAAEAFAVSAPDRGPSRS